MWIMSGEYNFIERTQKALIMAAAEFLLGRFTQLGTN